jgi:hypothetical protein
MIKEKAMELVAALRSGKYKQTGSRLRLRRLSPNGDSFCCLGVACDLVNAPYKMDGIRYRYSRYLPTMMGTNDDYTESFLPESVQKQYGFSSFVGERKDRQDVRIAGGVYSSLAVANDDGVPFSDIADYIEQNWEAL